MTDWKLSQAQFICVRETNLELSITDIWESYHEKAFPIFLFKRFLHPYESGEITALAGIVSKVFKTYCTQILP